MKAILYGIRPAGWAACWVLKRFWRECLTSPLNGLRLCDMPPPPLPTPHWVRVRTRMGGICGTDLSLLAQKQPPNSILQAFSSMPFVIGHENVAVVDEVGPAVGRSWLGRRVCVEPTLGCTARGIVPPCPRCAAGEFGACENFGDLGTGDAHMPPGTSIGYNKATGGSMGEYFVAHESQLVPVPDGLTDAEAVLTDPLACSLHAVLRTDLSAAKQVLVYGAGVLGLGTIACLRAMGYAGRIDALESAGYLEKLARSLGADNFIRLPRDARGRFDRIAELTGARVHRVRFGNLMLSGGYDAIFECVGSAQSLGESLKWAAARGQVVLIGTGHGGNIDLTPIWFRELAVKGAYGRQIENVGGRAIGTYQLVHELMAQRKLDVRAMVTHTFGIDQYRRAFTVAMNKGANQAVKVAIAYGQPNEGTHS